MLGKALDYLRRLNAPRSIEDSRPLRAAVWAAVSISVLALAPQGVMGAAPALASIALISLGSWLSRRRRYRLNLALKGLIMALTVAGYNAGIGRPARWLKEIDYENQSELIDQFDITETRQYVKLVIKHKYNYKSRRY